MPEAQEVSRSSLSVPTRIAVWAAAAGRCVLCARHLIDEQTHYRKVLTGELAHATGATSGANSPRGESEVSSSDRATAENLLLLCHDCHRRVDDRVLADDLYSVEWMLSRKRMHEGRVREVTNFSTLRPATVLRVTADVRGTPIVASTRQVDVALHSMSLTRMSADSRTGLIEVDLTSPDDVQWVWKAGIRSIDKAAARLREAVAASDTDVVVILAVAPIPLLAYLGSVLDDKVEAIALPRQRRDDAAAWTWTLRDDDAVPTFDVSTHGDEDGLTTEVVIRIDVSGPTKDENLPAELDSLPRVVLRAADGTSSPDLIDSPTALRLFGDAWRAALSLVEQKWPAARTCHVIAAVPAPAAVEIGRHRMRVAQPELAIYHLTDTGYTKALVIS